MVTSWQSPNPPPNLQFSMYSLHLAWLTMADAYYIPTGRDSRGLAADTQTQQLASTGLEQGHHGGTILPPPLPLASLARLLRQSVSSLWLSDSVLAV